MPIEHESDKHPQYSGRYDALDDCSLEIYALYKVQKLRHLVNAAEAPHLTGNRTAI